MKKTALLCASIVIAVVTGCTSHSANDAVPTTSPETTRTSPSMTSSVATESATSSRASKSTAAAHTSERKTRPAQGEQVEKRALSTPTTTAVKAKTCVDLDEGRNFPCTPSEYRQNVKKLLSHQDSPQPGDRVDAPDGRTYRICADDSGGQYNCSESEYSARHGKGMGNSPTLEECRAPATGSMFDACVHAYSRSQVGDDPRLPSNAVHPQTCFAWENGDVTLTPSEQQYCRDNSP